MARSAKGRYVVTGPTIAEPCPTYEDSGPALSRTLTEAAKVARDKAGVEATFYARDQHTDKIVGYSEADADGRITTRVTL